MPLLRDGEGQLVIVVANELWRGTRRKVGGRGREKVLMRSSPEKC